MKTPCARMSTAGERWPVSVSTTPRPISSSPIRANGPTGISPPNSSAIAVITHGIGAPRIAWAVAYGLWVWATPPTSGISR